MLERSKYHQIWPMTLHRPDWEELMSIDDQPKDDLLLWIWRAIELVGDVRERSDQLEQSELEATLAEADAWLEMSGAKSYEPFLHVERAELARLIGDNATRERELREAHRLFTEIGAPIRAAEVAKELGLATAS